MTPSVPHRATAPRPGLFTPLFDRILVKKTRRFGQLAEPCVEDAVQSTSVASPNHGAFMNRLHGSCVCSTLLAGLVIFSSANGAVTVSPNILYDSIPGVDPNLLALDIYAPEGADGTNPVMMIYHGGSFVDGDKSTPPLVHPKMEYYTDRGWVFVSVNYRLTNPILPANHPAQVSHPDHVQDAARSIAWVKENIQTFGGNADHLVLMGFSAGSQLVALVATDETRLGAEGLSLGDIDGVIALDGLYDVPLRYRQPPPLPPPQSVLIWGSDLASQQDMSPAYHVAPDKDIPPMVVVHQDLPNQTEQSNRFVEALQGAGVAAEVHNAVGLSHSEIGNAVGIEGHSLTLLVDSFLARLAGDYNDNGVLDAADYTIWRDHFGMQVTLPNDSSPGTVTLDDYEAWRSNFTAAATGTPFSPVPEPRSIPLLATALLRWRGFRTSRNAVLRNGMRRNAILP